jgi:CRP/FNR family cyclic AMP-dependent transcriptional regulator
VFEAILAASVELEEVTFPDGADVIVEGQVEVPLLVLVSGAVEVSREQVRVSFIDQPGAVFGELSALLSVPATASVQARGECVFRVCDDPPAFLRDRPELAVTIAQMLARRLDALTRYLVDIRNQYADHDSHLGVVDVVLESLSHHQGAQADPGSDREREAPY